MALLDLLLPQRCVACADPGTALCARCAGRLRRLGPPLCERCGSPSAWPVARCRECSGRRLAFARARAAVEYDEVVRRLVAAWKEHGLRRLARLAADLVVDTVEPPLAAAIVVVPADADRALQRGHHPAGRAPSRVCLVDDVYTTGATVNAAASALRRAGARRIEVITLARAIRGP